MIGALFANEWRALLRDGRGIAMLVVGALLAAGASWTSVTTTEREDAARAAATHDARCAWNDRHVDSAHSRAHYGDYVYRPSGPLAGLDSGLQAVTGRVIYTEAHRQNDAVHRPQQSAASLLRFERLEPSTVLQLLAPLLMILAGFGVVTSDRESGRLRLLRIQGAGSMQLLLAKTMALWTIGAAICALTVVVHLFVASNVDVGRVVAFLVLHLALLWIVAAVITGVSARVGRSGTAAAVLLAIWVLGAMVGPRLVAMSADAAHPLPSRDAFMAAMQEDRAQGLDGHDPRDARRQALEKKVLAEYGVERRQDLPVRLGGLIMQADEEYGAKVWDKHFGALEEQMLKQDAFVSALSFLNPLQATGQLSMAVAGTGLASHLDFTRQTEVYRRDLVRKLNHEDAHGVQRNAEGRLQRTTTREFYAGFSAFEYRPLCVGSLLGGRVSELLSVGIWLLGASGFLLLTARRLDRRGVL